MPNYRRKFVRGGTYFFTLVTYRRTPFLNTDLARRCLREAIDSIRSERPITISAFVMLPDHLHTIWVLPKDDANYPIRWKRIKENFTIAYLRHGGVEAPLSQSRISQGERGIWQRRYWEHTVEDESDLKRCVDYIHYNPRKHGLVERVRDWPWSSFHRYMEQGEYGLGWGEIDPVPNYDEPEWGESE